MKTSILYIRNNEEHNIIDILERFFENYNIISFVYDKLKPIEAINNINAYAIENSINILIGCSFDAFLVLNCDKSLSKCIFNACFKPSTYIRIQDWVKIENDFYLKYEPDKNKKVIAYYTLNDEVFGGSGYRILCSGFYRYIYRLSCKHILTYDALCQHKTKLLKWVELNKTKADQ